MNKLFIVKDTLANQISYYHLLLLLLSLPFDRFYSHIILISLILHTLINLNKNTIKPVFTLRTIVLQSVFIVTMISTSYSLDKAEAFRQWELDLPVLVVPLLFCLNPLDLKRYRPQLMLIFSVVCTLTIIFLFINAFATIRFYKMPWPAIISPAFTNQNFSEPIDMHATFFSLQVSVALIFMLTFWVKETSGWLKIFSGLCCLILAAGILQLSSKSIFAALLIIINIGFPYFVLRGGQRVKFIVTALLVSGLIAGVILNSRTFRDRFVTELKSDLSAPVTGQTVEPRRARWAVASELIKQSPFTGHGAGSEIQLLQDKFFAHRYYRSFLNRLNAHNEYLSFLIKSGIWGLAVYLVTLFWGFRKAYQERDILFFSFMILITIVSFSENILDADKGIIFYSVFFGFFVFTARNKSRLQTPIKRHKNLRSMATNKLAVASL